MPSVDSRPSAGRVFVSGQRYDCFRLLGLALALVLVAAYIVIDGNPFARGTAAPTSQTAAVRQGTLTVTVIATGPVTNPHSVPLSSNDDFAAVWQQFISLLEAPRIVGDRHHSMLHLSAFAVGGVPIVFVKWRQQRAVAVGRAGRGRPRPTSGAAVLRWPRQVDQTW